MGWQRPAGVRGSEAAVRLPVSLLDRGPEDCLEYAALRARPRIKGSAPGRRAPYETFPLRLVLAALDLVEFSGLPSSVAVARVLTPETHEGVAAWVRYAVDAYLAGCAELDAEVSPVRAPRISQDGDWALVGWARWYASADGSVREVRRIRMGRSTGASPSALGLAYLAAFGRLAAGSVLRPSPVAVLPADPAPSRVRIVDLVPAPGERPDVVFDGPPSSVLERYPAGAVEAVLNGGRRVPGFECATCKLRSSCPELPRIPGLLGLGRPGTHRRTFTLSAGRRHAVCPAQAHLRGLRLPGPRSGSATDRRALLLHQWLRQAHARGIACSAQDLASADAEILPYLRGHLGRCPLSAACSEVRPEPSVAVHDSEADVLVVARPDLLYREGGRVHCREYKLGEPEGDPLRTVPQLALAVCLLSDGAYGPAGEGVAELEIMTPEHGRVLRFSAADAPSVSRARATLTGLAEKWHRDVVFAPRPGAHCAACPVSRWCPAGG